ncbi:RHS repeat-associated core domain-containing protein [Nitrospirillum sp. BR 11163]|uniref:RHS repeat-associated core domain-containing protein n=1 Tax=Nitrospirillum sp. BR 11163 TaxID=3104323 RepID=UPI002AFF9719|nr:RHS repeat-associated core domain-containing protein [Nitrospirillum sp. BR 11163]MEA1673572.1 RHS repeat-associated core domain-containing protein [Nitrospirillum sp. BR 11163]
MDGGAPQYGAARLGDPIQHTSALSGFIAGAAIGLGAALAVIAVVGTGGAALGVIAAVGGAMAATGGGALLGEALGSTFTDQTGVISPDCSDTVLINDKPAARAIQDAAACSRDGPPDQHIAQGSKTVFINGKPAARIGDKLECDGSIMDGSHDVFIGRDPGTYMSIHGEVPDWANTAAEYLMIGGSLLALGAGAAGAFMAEGLCGLATFGETTVIGMAGGYAGSKVGGAIGQAVGGERGRIIGEALGGAAGGFAGGKLATRYTAGHPVDVATGELFTQAMDFEVAGPLPLVWSRTWMSSSTLVGELGSGWHHPHDMVLYRWINGGGWAARLADGRLAFFTDPAPGRPSLNVVERLVLHTDGQRYWLATYGGLAYVFADRDDQSGLRHLAHVVDPNDNAILLQRGPGGRLTGIQDSAGRAFVVTTDEAGRITAVDGPDPTGGDQPLRLVSYTYDAAGDLVEARDARGNAWHYRYDNHLLVEETRRGGLRFQFVWDDVALGRRARCIDTWGVHLSGEAGLYRARMAYDVQAHTTVVTTGRGAVTRYRWNSLGLVEEEVNPVGGVTRRRYDEAGRLVAVIGPDGGALRFTYDSLGRLGNQSAPDGAITALAYVQDAGHADLTSPFLGHLAQVVRADGAVEQFTYDRRGNLASYINPLGSATRYTRDTRGLPLAIQDALGLAARFTWSPEGDLLAEGTGKADRRRYTHDALGRVVAVQAGRDAPLRLERDANGNITTVLRPDGGTVALEYDAEDHVTLHRDPLGHVTRWRYDGLPYPLERTAADGTVFSYHYDSELNLVALLNPKGEQYRLDYDLAGRLVGETGFDGRRLDYYRDAVGFVVAATDQGRVTRFVRDPVGRLLETHYADGGTRRYSYDVLGRLLTADTPDTQLAFAYDAAGQPVSERQGSLEIRFQRDARGRRVATLLPDGRRIDQAWGPDGLPAAVGLDGKALARFSHDASGREVERLAGGIHQAQSFDPQGRLTRQEGRRLGGGEAVYARSYDYDGADAVTAIEDARRGVRRYRYDACDRLLAVDGTDPENFVTDPAGNILASGPDAQFWGGEARGDRLLVHGDAKFEYDAWGNRVKEWRAAGGAVTIDYRYDAGNRLVEVAESSRLGSSLTRFGYDALGRRVWKESTRTVPLPANDTGGQEIVPTAAQRTAFLWDGDSLLAESTPADLLATVYIYEPGTFRPLAQLRRAEPGQPTQAYHYHLDHLGTPQELTNDNGEVVWAADYKAWGGLARVRVAAVPNPLRFQGQYHDTETGLHYNRHRYYAPAEGCFLNQDPIRLKGGSNIAAYAPNPVQWIDPLGLACNTWNEFQKAQKGNFANSTEAATSYKNLVANQSPWPEGYVPADATLTPGTRFNMAMSPGQASTRPGAFGTYDDIPDVNYVRNDLAVKQAWKPDVDRVVTYEVTKPLPVKVGPVGPQIDEATSSYLPGGGSQLQMNVPPADRMDYLKVVGENPIF